MRRKVPALFFALSLLLNMLLVPLAANAYLRFIYVQTLANWRAHFLHPDTVYIGDSIMAGGRGFTQWSDVNLGTSGLQTYQIAAALGRAAGLGPKHIVVMAGTNDAIEGPIDRAEIAGLWRTMCRDPRLIVTLAPPTRSPELNRRLAEIEPIVRASCPGRAILSLAALRGPDGLIEPRYTVDGVHLTSAAYAVWNDQLKRQGL